MDIVFGAMGRKRKYATVEESNEAKRRRDRERQARMIDIGDEKTRWSQLAAEAGLSDGGFAKLLLDR